MVRHYQNVLRLRKTWEHHKYLFFQQLLTQQIPLLLLFSAKLLLLFILLSGSRHMILSLTQQVRALPAIRQHTQTPSDITTCTK